MLILQIQMFLSCFSLNHAADASGALFEENLKKFYSHHRSDLKDVAKRSAEVFFMTRHRESVDR